MNLKIEMYKLLLQQISALLTDKHDMIANFSNASVLLNQTLPDINLVGFYFYKQD